MKKRKRLLGRFLFFSVREKIRTPDLLVRSQTLYPAELHVHYRIRDNDYSTLLRGSCQAISNLVYCNISK